MHMQGSALNSELNGNTQSLISTHLYSVTNVEGNTNEDMSLIVTFL